MWTPTPFDPREAAREPYEKIGHRFGPLKGFHKSVCKGCGLISASNDLTEWAIAVGCDWKNHPSFQHKVRSLCNALR